MYDLTSLTSRAYFLFQVVFGLYLSKLEGPLVDFLLSIIDILTVLIRSFVAMMKYLAHITKEGDTHFNSQSQGFCQSWRRINLAVYIIVARKQRKGKMGRAKARYDSQEHIPTEVLPPIRPHLLLFTTQQCHHTMNPSRD